MNNHIHPCLWFNDNAKEAAQFYCSLLPHSKITVDTPMVVNFELLGQKMMGLNGGPRFIINPSISFFIYCKTEDETNQLYHKFAQDGKALMPLGKYDWSECYGWIQDRFGVSWQVMLGAEQSLLPSMLFTSAQLGKAEEAITFYTSLFDHSSVDAMAKYPAGSPYEGKLMYSESRLNGKRLIAMDGPGGHTYSFNEAVSFVIDCNTQEEIDFYWNHLTANGGEESMCGWLKDKFGVSWQVVPTVLGKLMSDPEKSQRVMNALLKMKKLDIAALQSA
jgi:predicted 3-demethylubiquinone-9 3-methyltransferase (glyoxalase superfamily)